MRCSQTPLCHGLCRFEVPRSVLSECLALHGKVPRGSVATNSKGQQLNCDRLVSLVRSPCASSSGGCHCPRACWPRTLRWPREHRGSLTTATGCLPCGLSRSVLPHRTAHVLSSRQCRRSRQKFSGGSQLMTQGQTCSIGESCSRPEISCGAPAGGRSCFIFAPPVLRLRDLWWLLKTLVAAVPCAAESTWMSLQSFNSR